MIIEYLLSKRAALDEKQWLAKQKAMERSGAELIGALVRSNMYRHGGSTFNFDNQGRLAGFSLGKLDKKYPLPDASNIDYETINRHGGDIYSAYKELYPNEKFNGFTIKQLAENGGVRSNIDLVR